MLVSGLLSGIRVLDVTTVLAGPFAAYQLSMLGADVIKVEVPGTGDLARDMGDDAYLRDQRMGAPFVAQNSGKRSVEVDLKSSAGHEIFSRLVASADVLVENMRPGVLDRLGFGWEALHAINPRLVYVAISGFGQTGPLAHRAAYDQIIQGLSGMVDVTGRPEGEPLRAGFPVADILGGYAGAFAVCAALVRREREGVGSVVDVSMLETAITALGWVVSEQFTTGRPAQRYGNDNPASSPSGSFRTGHGMLTVAANTQTQFESLCWVLGRADLLDDPRFATRAERKRHRAELTEQLEVALATRSAAEWEEMLAKVSVPAGQVITVGEAIDQPQVRERGLVHEVELALPECPRVQVLGSALRVDGEVQGPVGPPPRLGQHTAEILAELGYSPLTLSALKEAGVV